MIHTPQITPEWMQQRANDFAAMDGNTFTRSSGILNDAELKAFLSKSDITGESDASQFIGFKTIFGFTSDGADFLVVKDQGGYTDAGAHLIFLQNISN